MPRLTVEGHGHVDADPGATLLEACEQAGIPMETECGGFAACNSCRVRVIDGMAALSARSEAEDPFLDEDDQRLGCQARLRGDVIVRLDPGM